MAALLMRLDGGMTSARFEGFVRHILAPTLRPGQVVVADNPRAHHTPGARAAIEARGASLRQPMLPAGSPTAATRHDHQPSCGAL